MCSHRTCIDKSMTIDDFCTIIFLIVIVQTALSTAYLLKRVWES
jgi:hypothetical protein